MQRQQTKFWPVELFCFFQWVSALYIYVVFFVLFFWQVVKVKAVFIAATMSTRDAYLNIVDVCELIKRLGLSGFFLYISSGGSWRLVAESRATWSPIWSEVIWMIWLIFPDLSLCFFRCCLRQRLRTHTEKAAGVLRSGQKEYWQGVVGRVSRSRRTKQTKSFRPKSWTANQKPGQGWSPTGELFSLPFIFFWDRPGSSVKNEIKRAL